MIVVCNIYRVGRPSAARSRLCSFYGAPALKRCSRSCDMKRAWTLSTCFEHFGAARSRQHFGGSAISHDGGTVVVAMWEDEIIRQDGQATYRSQFGPTLKGKSRGVSLQWITHLKWAIAHCEVCVRVVVLTAEEMAANPRIIRSCYPDDGLTMRITHFDPKTGFFRACTVSPREPTEQ
jgi:hypothetical protein